ncbi:MAG: hypothetical protein EBU33_10200, partial [Sphingobacteriia bacterium]|nr:hypothetical protein [Sphingobacteriia bacterium]
LGRQSTCHLPQVQEVHGEERYYTDAEINALPAQQGNTYRAKMREGKTPNEIRGIFTRIMRIDIEAKYAPAGAPPPVPVVAQASAGGLLASITAGKALNATAGDHPDQKPVAAAAPVEQKQANPMMGEMAKRIAAIKAAKEAEEARKIAAGENPDGDDSGSDSDWD